MFAVPVAGFGQGAKGAEKGSTTVPVGGPVTEQALITRYETLAASAANSTSLVNGLRSGTPVTLTYLVREQRTCQEPPTTVTVKEPVYLKDPATGRVILGPDGKPFIIGFQTVTKTVQSDPYDCSVEVNQNVTFTPPTGNMGLGNVDIALAFTAAQLLELQIEKALPKQLEAALMGGQVEYGTSNPQLKKSLPGILKLRAGGKGWGQIADDLGYKLK
jgi:hypothetical protein